MAQLVGNRVRQGDPVVLVDAARLVRTAHATHVGDPQRAVEEEWEEEK